MDTTTITSWILSHLREVHTLADVASHFGVSAETLRKDFARQERIPFSGFLVRARVEAAEYLLEETDLQCKEVAFEVGFTREDTAAHVFKAFTGHTMNAYREALLSRHNDLE